MDPYVYSPVGEGHPPGIRNEGNICYITAVLQCMLSVVTWKDSLCQAIWSTQSNLPVLNSLESLFIGMVVCCKDPYYSCDSFLHTLKEKWAEYRHLEQEDCCAFLRFILNAVHEETLVSIDVPTFMKNTTLHRTIIQAWASRERSPVASLFGSLSVRSTVCLNTACGESSDHCDPVSFYITLNLPDKKHCSLQECLTMWSSEEFLHDAKCTKCSAPLRSRVKFGRLPPCLIFQLGRFTNTDHFLAINNCIVEYGHSLDMKEYVVAGLQTKTKYDLVAVTCHRGGLAAGHYTSICKRDNRWFNFDDSKVSTTSARRVIASGAYLLWYSLTEDPVGNLPFDPDATLLPTSSVDENHNLSPNSQACSSDTENTLIMSNYEDSSDSEDAIQPAQLVPDKKKRVIPPVKAVPSLKKSTAVKETVLPPPSSKEKRNISFHQDIELIQDPCNHPEIDIDIRDPLLGRADVDGGDLDLTKLNSHRVPELERLLRMYGLPSKGNKQELIDRILTHVARGKGEKINPAFEAGIWHQKKRARLMDQQHVQSDLPIAPVGGKHWHPFPSVHIPEGFHYLDIVHYFENIPEMEYNYKKGVVKTEAPAVVPPLHLDSSDDDDAADDDDDAAKEGHDMTFQDLCRRAIKKCLKKGEQFLYSGRLLSMLDTKKDKHYFIRAQVQASMEDKIYGVIIIFNVGDGSICTAECSCKAQALKRCGHIAAVLLRLWQHVFTKGYEAVTTTGTQCYWRKSGNAKNPGLLIQKEYESRKPLGPRVNFDPIPTQFKTDGLSQEDLKTFKENLQKSTPTCLFLYHLDSGFIPSTVMDTEIILDLETEIGLMTLATECSKLLWKMARKCRGHTAPFEVPNTRGQHLSKVWHEERALCVNPSSSKNFLGLTKEITTIKWLRRKLWLMDPYENKAMMQGKKLESEARKTCESLLKKYFHKDYSIVETGLWKNPKFPQMACSPDGFITLPHHKNKLLEIKVLTMLNSKPSARVNEIFSEEEEVDNPQEEAQPINPLNFEEEMTPKQKSSFYLKRNKEGEIILKKNHSYNYQIQMCLDILELSECILCVYSKTGCKLVDVQYDPFFWEEKRCRLLQKHREIIIPEAILGRTKRWLPPSELIYSEFHEDPEDEYFDTDNDAKDNVPI